MTDHDYYIDEQGFCHWCDSYQCDDKKEKKKKEKTTLEKTG